MIEGADSVQVYHARITGSESGQTTVSPGERHFCRPCGSARWVWDPRWPELVHPFASAIDSEIPTPPERSYLMLDFKASWVELRADQKDRRFGRYPDESIAQWHERLGLVAE